MGTKVDSKSYFPGFYSMRDLNEDSSSSSWPLCYVDRTVTNGHYYNGFMPRMAMDGYPGYGKDALKQKMLEHEAVFKNQVFELHRVYRIQRAMMEEHRRKELHRVSMEPSSSSSHRGPQEEARKWHMPGFPLLSSTYERTSISGVEIANSPMSCTKGVQDSVNDSKLLDSRPLKVRKKLFDLELPADEYIDTEEGQESPEFKASHASSYTPNVNLKSEPEYHKLSSLRHAGATTDHRMDVSTSASCLRKSILLADLNEPIDVEETTAPSSTAFLGHSSINRQTNGVNHPAKSNAGFFGVNAKTACYRDGSFINSSVDSKVNDRGPLSHIYEAGPSKSNLDSVTPGLQQANSHPLQCILNPHDHPPGIYPTRRSREDLWRGENHHFLESSDRSRVQSNNRFLGPSMPSNAPGSDPLFSSSCFSGTWAQNMSSWANPTKIFTQKITSSDSFSNPAAAMDRVLQISAECRESYGGKWHVDDDIRLNPGFGSAVSTWNGFYHGSASGSKELKVLSPSAGFDYLTNHGFRHFSKDSSFAGPKPAIDINLNEVVSKSSCYDVGIVNDASTIDGKGKPADHLSTLPWLKNKPAPSSYPQASSSQLCCKTETVGDLNEPFASKVTSDSSERKTETAVNQNVKKILGFPIFETRDPKTEPLPHASTSASFSCPAERNSADKKRKNLVIDINLECEPEEQISGKEQTAENEKQAKRASVRDLIDLNSCVTDCEDAFAPSYESKTANVKVILDIDLESPVLPEDEDANTPSYEIPAGAVASLLSSQNRTDSSKDEVLTAAAEVIVSISSCCPKIHVDDGDIDLLETSLAESFVWFVNAVSSCPNDSQLTDQDGSPKDSSPEMDDFEARTLRMPEMKEEDYMPTPSVPEAQKSDDTAANSTLTRPRRGQSRRGRPRRDFQRDILPGLTSLSRHEVTEDIQTFGGLMRATGHHWVSGLARRNGTRNGSGRGRRRAVAEAAPAATPSPGCNPLIQQLSKVEGGLEERSLTGWGKTPRRPRRQRCPAGNPAAVVST